MIAASSAAWLGDLRRAIGGPNFVGAVYPALIDLETDSDAAMLISLRRKTCSGLHAATVRGAVSPGVFAMSKKKDREAKALLRPIGSGCDTALLSYTSFGLGI
jgi:hypothetical protein